jgi:hypothetical protein
MRTPAIALGGVATHLRDAGRCPGALPPATNAGAGVAQHAGEQPAHRGSLYSVFASTPVDFFDGMHLSDRASSRVNDSRRAAAHRKATIFPRFKSGMGDRVAGCW